LLPLAAGADASAALPPKRHASTLGRSDGVAAAGDAQPAAELTAVTADDPTLDDGVDAAHLLPRVFAPYVQPPGSVPRAVQIQR
jgi:hypothetical protein